ncbi:hypothetical protein [Thermoflavimicrobium dichotomicum]|uniref:Uncharacterized protein n=1 Tax=Thermoflavimicrobium dichotomicum TaxID=46223 RepID=A0A1I3VJM6_9BACL|nr:hypothetical protein [Thermoflavimicrobium dichotomicum]SFJ95372.1 hypothetical protein SAMN05421852_1574 [Thermoflavimicrobium dichotomicum]
MYTIREVSKLMKVNQLTDKKSELLRWINEEKIQCEATDEGTFRIPKNEVQRLFEAKWKPVVFQQIKQYEMTIQTMLSQLNDPYAGALTKIESLHGLIRWGFAALASYQFRMEHDVVSAKQLYYFALQVSEVYEKYVRQALTQYPYIAYLPASLKDKVLWALFSQRFDLAYHMAEHYEPNGFMESNKIDLLIKYLLLKKDREATELLKQLAQEDTEINVEIIDAILSHDQKRVNELLYIEADAKYKYYTQEMIHLPYQILCDDLLLYGWIAQCRGIPVTLKHPIMAEECFKKHRLVYPDLSFLPDEFKVLISNAM